MARDSKRGAHNGSLLHFQAALMRTSLAGTQGVITHRHFLLSTIRHVIAGDAVPSCPGYCLLTASAPSGAST